MFILFALTAAVVFTKFYDDSKVLCFFAILLKSVYTIENKLNYPCENSIYHHLADAKESRYRENPSARYRRPMQNLVITALK